MNNKMQTMQTTPTTGIERAYYGNRGNRNNTASTRPLGMDKKNAASQKRMQKESRRINRRKRK